MKTTDTQTQTAKQQRKPALSPELLELVHLLDVFEAAFREKVLAAG